ncbi:predicted protein [Histoplasma mississippiense (nom. inval.)]|uniref:predicted protein n=1 Tax=Ajellomyces capsulatus (strain NAm1 / WU24) TaxID=2059318 RepID=UPI000157BF2A|nr:predicted protein [Histoplasma mississippiense (nom. inval.)]EDN06768.1 predicted protein [Histoplasma mississippiense (nom. inval.)]
MMSTILRITLTLRSHFLTPRQPLEAPAMVPNPFQASFSRETSKVVTGRTSLVGGGKHPAQDFSGPRFGAVSNVVGPQPVFSKDTRAETRQLVSHCMELAQSMVDSWIPPVWRGCSDSGLILKRTELEKELSLIEPRPPAIMEDHADAVAPANITYSDMKNGTTASNANIDFPSIPKTILLRCDDYVPVSMPDTPDAVCRVDVVRELRSLGWEKYPHHFTPAVLNVSGHHFNLFTDEYIDQISIQIRQSCKMLERDS